MNKYAKYVLTTKDRIFLSRKSGLSVSEIYLEDLNISSALLADFNQKKEIINSDYPLDYSIGELEIPDLGLKLTLTPDVLIPREETIDWLKTCVLEKWIDHKIKTYEVGTGQGMIGIYLAKNGYKVTMTDISEPVLTIAQENADLNKLDSRIYNFIKSDLLNDADLRSGINQQKAWNLVANLPYVPVGDKLLPYSDSVKYEPEEAIYSGADGLDCFRKLIEQIKTCDTLPDFVVFELDPRNIKAAEALLKNNYNISIKVDHNGLERVIAGNRLKL